MAAPAQRGHDRVEGPRRMVAAPAALPAMAAGQDASAAYRDAAQTRVAGGAGLALGTQRARPVVEQRCQPHESRLPESLLRPAEVGLYTRHQSESSASLVNRRMRNRTYGGVGGGRSIPAPYPINFLMQSQKPSAATSKIQLPCRASQRLTSRQPVMNPSIKSMND